MGKEFAISLGRLTAPQPPLSRGTLGSSREANPILRQSEKESR